MPTFETLPRFTTDLQHLTPAQRRRFHRVVLNSFILDLGAGCFRPGLPGRDPAAGSSLPGEDLSDTAFDAFRDIPVFGPA